MQITAAVELTADATPNSARVDVARFDREADRQAKQGRDWLGIVYTHPSVPGEWARPSDTDLKSLRACSLANDGKPFVSVILSQEHQPVFGMGRDRGWANPTTSVFVMRRENGAMTTDVWSWRSSRRGG